MKGGKKELLAKLLYHSKIVNISGCNIFSKLIVFNYHRIKPMDTNFSSLFDDDIFGPDINQFKEQLKWLKKNTTIISEKNLIDMLNSENIPSGTYVLITFDDGYRDNYDLAYPVLRELDVPAIFFISTNLINTRQLGWWDIIAYLIKNTKKPSIEFEGEKFSLKNGRRKVIRFFQNKIQLEKHEKTKSLLTNLAEECELSMPDLDKQDEQLMNWDQIREVSNNNISIASHGHTHRVLSTLDAISQKEEVTLSKTIIEREIGKSVKSFAFPVGNYRHFNENTIHSIKQEGYKLGFSYIAGINRLKYVDPFTIKRICAPKDIIMLSAKSLFPRVFSWGDG